MTNLDSILQSRDITLPTKVHLVKAMVFPVVMYGCESWTIKKAESEVAQLCPTLCDPMNCSLPGSSIHGIFQARILEWVAISFSILFHFHQEAFEFLFTFLARTWERGQLRTQASFHRWFGEAISLPYSQNSYTRSLRRKQRARNFTEAHTIFYSDLLQMFSPQGTGRTHGAHLGYNIWC